MSTINTDKAYAEVRMAANAREALANAALTAAWGRYRDKIIEQLQACDPKDVELVMILKRHLTSLAVVRKNLEIMVADGIEADAKLNWEREQSALRRAGQRVRGVVERMRA